jgi:hypothetical protein
MDGHIHLAPKRDRFRLSIRKRWIKFKQKWLCLFHAQFAKCPIFQFSPSYSQETDEAMLFCPVSNDRASKLESFLLTDTRHHPKIIKNTRRGGAGKQKSCYELEMDLTQTGRGYAVLCVPQKLLKAVRLQSGWP